MLFAKVLILLVRHIKQIAILVGDDAILAGDLFIKTADRDEKLFLEEEPIHHFFFADIVGTDRGALHDKIKPGIYISDLQDNVAFPERLPSNELLQVFAAFRRQFVDSGQEAQHFFDFYFDLFHGNRQGYG